MKVDEPKISILVSDDVTRIELFDAKSRIRFATIKLTPQQLSQALSRLSNVDCEMELNGLDNINKTHQHTDCTFEIPKRSYEFRDSEEIKELGRMACPNGWVPDLSFNSQNSFFSKDGKEYARMIIRRWV